MNKCFEKGLDSLLDEIGVESGIVNVDITITDEREEAQDCCDSKCCGGLFGGSCVEDDEEITPEDIDDIINNCPYGDKLEQIIFLDQKIADAGGTQELLEDLTSQDIKNLIILITNRFEDEQNEKETE